MDVGDEAWVVWEYRVNGTLPRREVVPVCVVSAGTRWVAVLRDDGYKTWFVPRDRCHATEAAARGELARLGG